MKKIIDGIIILAILAVIISSCSKEPTGEKCSKLNADARDQCCQAENTNTSHELCLGYWHYNPEKNICEYICVAY